jgi:hypothetical protein
MHATNAKHLFSLFMPSHKMLLMGRRLVRGSAPLEYFQLKPSLLQRALGTMNWNSKSALMSSEAFARRSR